jgi:hypothetical protein
VDLLPPVTQLVPVPKINFMNMKQGHCPHSHSIQFSSVAVDMMIAVLTED